MPFVPWLVGVSVVSVLIGVILAPVMILRLPADYFRPKQRIYLADESQHPVLRALILTAKNALGALLVTAGVAMLFLPGQGFLTLFAGLIVLDYPGKFRFERWLVRRPHVLTALNWLRARHGRAPLLAPPEGVR